MISLPVFFSYLSSFLSLLSLLSLLILVRLNLSDYKTSVDTPFYVFQITGRLRTLPYAVAARVRHAHGSHTSTCTTPDATMTMNGTMVSRETGLRYVNEWGDGIPGNMGTVRHTCSWHTLYFVDNLICLSVITV